MGVEALGDDTEARFDVVVRYEFDYLFGGPAALAAAIAAANAAALAEQETEAQVLASAGRRRRRSNRERVEEEEEESVCLRKLIIKAVTLINYFILLYSVSNNGAQFSSLFNGRSLDNVLTRTLADDQVDILSVSLARPPPPICLG